MGFLENVALAASRGVAPADFAATTPAMTALLLDHMADAARRIAARAHGRPAVGSMVTSIRLKSSVESATTLLRGPIYLGI